LLLLRLHMLNALFTLGSAAQARSMRKEVLSMSRSTPHFGRKFYHFLMGLFCYGLYAFVLTREEALILLGSIGGLLMLADIVRLKYPAFNAIALRLFGKIMRREELRSISGNSFYILGLLVVVFFFSKPVVLLSVLFLAIGDPIAAIVGTRWGRTKITKRKSLEGSVANFLATALASLLFALFYLQFGIPQSLLLALLGGTVSTLVELLPAPIDDNFTIPVGSALLLSLFIS